MKQRFFRTNKWAIVLGVLAFTFSVLVALFSIGPAILIMFITALAVSIGYLKDRHITVQQLIRSFK